MRAQAKAKLAGEAGALLAAIHIRTVSSKS